MKHLLFIYLLLIYYVSFYPSNKNSQACTGAMSCHKRGL
jgi:hypothetical protein